MSAIPNDVLAELRRAFADYVSSEGCSCCQNTEAHAEAMARMGQLLSLEPYDDGSGYNVYVHSTRNNPVPWSPEYFERLNR